MSESTTVTSPEIRQEPESLETLAARKHAAFAAKINGSVFGKEKHHLQEEYDNAENAYIDAVRLQISEQLEADDDLTIDEQIDLFEGLVNERVAQDRDAQQAELIAHGGNRAKFLSWYANLPRGKKIAVTAGLAAGGAAAGMVASTLGAGVAVTAVGLGAYRLVRGYNIRAAKIYENHTDTPVYVADKESFNDESIDRALAFLRKDSQATIERAEKIKKRAVYGALGAVALGSAAGAVMHETPVGEIVRDKAGEWASRISSIFTPDANAQDIDIPFTAPVEHPGGAINDNLSGRNVHLYGRSEEVADIQSDAQLEALQSSFTVEAGHGYTQELIQSVQNVYGVKLSPQEAWDLHKELVRTAGSDYINLLDGHGADTYDMGGSKYNIGIAHSGQAEWSDKAVKVLDHKFGSDVVTDQPHVDVETPQSSETYVIPSHTEHNLVQGTGGTNFEPQAETPSLAPTNLSTHQITGDMGAAEKPEVDIPAPTGAESQLSGIAAAQEAMKNGTDGINWEDMTMDTREMYGMLEVGDVDAINSNETFQNTLEYIRRDIGNLTYPGTDTLIIERTGTGFSSQWTMNEIPAGSKMHPKVLDVFKSYMDALKQYAP